MTQDASQLFIHVLHGPLGPFQGHPPSVGDRPRQGKGAADDDLFTGLHLSGPRWIQCLAFGSKEIRR